MASLPTPASWHRFLGAAALTVLLGGPPARAQEGKSAQDLLAAADEIRNPNRDFSVTTTLVEYRAGKKVATSALVIYSKLVSDSGQYNNLVRFLTPKRDAGKLVLRNGMDLWFYDPTSRTSIRISPQARLLGQASNGDVMSTNLAKAYTAEMAGTEAVQVEPGHSRSCFKLRLTASRRDVAYPLANYWIEESTSRPLKAQFLTSEGRLLKTALFRRFETALGRERPTETVILDGLDQEWITVLRATDFRWRTIPDTWLQRDYLPRFNADDE